MSSSTASFTSREETFCRTVAAGASAAMAARVAGARPESAPRIGASLYRRPDIQDRIGVLVAEWEAEHAARLRRAVERLDQIHEAAFEKGQLGVALKAIVQSFRLLDGETRRLRQPHEEPLPPLPEAAPEAAPAFPAASSPASPTASPPAPPPAPRSSAVAALSGEDRRCALRQRMEADLGLPPATPWPPGLPLAAGPVRTGSPATERPVTERTVAGVAAAGATATVATGPKSAGPGG